MPGRTRPIDRFAAAAAKCSKEGSAYGKCILADYNNVHKDKCVTEFLKLKECYIVGFGSSWIWTY
ncbi:hypothetical protein K491DRAFT_664608 [Lophiostoma macrostomum CBS 122681]|uniref:IMS import disulfide relay-system CHCH-CHCH-like Cx9C domain-containing protein n=1 Tax=Lophiostoma macrostomum CBS 122681 TaxID=1314788 RepID=A0A6A6SZQ0_9PLEO|nr:hypothetical protein K491DRAFT_664608 [Lophiostoma macrostomum CBS 122681]